MVTTPYMTLSLPTVSSTVGPTWASMLNAALTAVDSHTHVAGSGAQVPTAGLNINAALSFNGYDATTLRSARLKDQGAPLNLATDIGCLYRSAGDLYYNNAAGQQIQVTAGAALNASSIGAIGGDYSTSTASEVYLSASQTFQFFQAANKYANLDAGSVIIREPGATSPKGITLKSPTSLAADYALTMPAALPAATKILTLDNLGSIASVYDVDGITLEVSSNALRVKAGSLTTSHLSASAGITALQTDATSVATALKLVVRDAGGRTQFADPSASADAATKGYVDGLGQTIAVTSGTGWSSGTIATLVKVGRLYSLAVDITAGSSASFSSIVTFPAGTGPSGQAYFFPGMVYDNSTGDYYAVMCAVGDAGVAIHLWQTPASGWTSSAPITIQSLDRFIFHATWIR